MFMLDKELEDMEKFMTILMDVKVSLAEQNGKLDNLIDIKKKAENANNIANGAEMRSIENQKDIQSIQLTLSAKASKEEIQQIIKKRENLQKILPSWVAVIISILTLLLTIYTTLN